ncbi:unnamed protein product [Sphenostylis stenocarpa]|uniref:Histidine-containing phosphotransfer protein n=1 Tax=Sphenostylis stenocarpa TaxID=92480 RepID=A0AA86VPT2_9FABA|nr:unnamed protein product [Sphenostylis stenocarpa]
MKLAGAGCRCRKLSGEWSILVGRCEVRREGNRRRKNAMKCNTANTTAPGAMALAWYRHSRDSNRSWKWFNQLAKTGLPLWMLGFGADLLWADMNRLLAFLFHQGVLDEQFLQLQQLQDEASPNFVSEVVNIYFHESEKLLTSLRGLLMERELSDYKKMGIHLNQFMGSSSSIGAKRVTNICVAFRAATDQSNRAGCLRALEMLEHEYCYLKNKLHELFQFSLYPIFIWLYADRAATCFGSRSEVPCAESIMQMNWWNKHVDDSVFPCGLCFSLLFLLFCSFATLKAHLSS